MCGRRKRPVWFFARSVRSSQADYSVRPIRHASLLEYSPEAVRNFQQKTKGQLLVTLPKMVKSINIEQNTVKIKDPFLVDFVDICSAVRLFSSSSSSFSNCSAEIQLVRNHENFRWNYERRHVAEGTRTWYSSRCRSRKSSSCRRKVKLTELQ